MSAMSMEMGSSDPWLINDPWSTAAQKLHRQDLWQEGWRSHEWGWSEPEWQSWQQASREEVMEWFEGTSRGDRRHSNCSEESARCAPGVPARRANHLLDLSGSSAGSRRPRLANTYPVEFNG